jgi:hypothetical protein
VENGNPSKKQELFRSNVEQRVEGNLLGSQTSQKDLLNISSNEGSGVADERDITASAKFEATEQAYSEFILQEKTMSIKEEESKEVSPENSPYSKRDPRNIKFILFQSQNVINAKKKAGYKNDISARV